MSTVPTISVEQLADRHRKLPVDLIDVRTPVEFRETHLEFARNVPLESLDPHQVMQQRPDPDQPLYVICQSGNRGAIACRSFLNAGYTDVVNVGGGTQAWLQAGNRVIRGKRAISLERQVRIAAGFLVLLGALLGFFVNVGFIGLSAFVGAGLMFAGITDTCGMAMVLARMPWNQVGNGKAA